MSCPAKQQAFTRPKWDDIHQIDDARITSYQLRYRLNTPAANCPTTYPVDSTTRIQKSGASWVPGQWKTDVESDLKGINRMSPRIRAVDNTPALFDPRANYMTTRGVRDAPDSSSPVVFNRMTNAPCTLRGTGVNRWEWLPSNPQAHLDTPFEHFIPSRTIDKEKCKMN
jgi:hypothetical protein